MQMMGFSTVEFQRKVLVTFLGIFISFDQNSGLYINSTDSLQKARR